MFQSVFVPFAIAVQAAFIAFLIVMMRRGRVRQARIATWFLIAGWFCWSVGFVYQRHGNVAAVAGVVGIVALIAAMAVLRPGRENA